MNILILEDQGSVSILLKNLLEDNNHKIFVAYNIPDADSFIHENNIDLFIIDLNFSPEGLDEKKFSETKYGKLTGWIFIKEKIYSNAKLKDKPIIILSEFLDDLKNVASDTELKNIKLIRKRGSESSIEKLIRIINGFSN